MPLRTLLICGYLFCALAFGVHAQETAPPTKDTFAPDIVPAALMDFRKVVNFKAYDNPKMLKVSEADFMEDTEFVLGFELQGEARAYPLRFIAWHHIINDKLTPKEGVEAFVTVTY